MSIPIERQSHGTDHGMYGPGNVYITYTIGFRQQSALGVWMTV